MKQIKEGVSGDGLEGDFWEEGPPLCIQSQFECLHGCSVHNLLWQFVPVRDYSNAESMLAAMGFTPPLVNLERMTSKPNAGGGSKNCAAWKVEIALCGFYWKESVYQLLVDLSNFHLGWPMSSVQLGTCTSISIPRSY